MAGRTGRLLSPPHGELGCCWASVDSRGEARPGVLDQWVPSSLCRAARTRGAVAVLAALTVSILLANDGMPARAGAVVAPAGRILGSGGHSSSRPPASPAFNGDAGDPDVVESAGTYYAFTTGTALGNHIQALVDTSGSPASGWRSYTGHDLRVDRAAATPPGKR